MNDTRVKALVYIAGLAPDEGETVAQVFYQNEKHSQSPQLAPDADGFIWMPDEGFGNAFSHHATPEQIALSAAVQRPIAVKCIQEPVATPAWGSKPSWYLIAEEDRMINPKTQHFMAKRMSYNKVLPCRSHTTAQRATESCGHHPESKAGSVLLSDGSQGQRRELHRSRRKGDVAVHYVMGKNQKSTGVRVNRESDQDNGEL